MYPMRQTNKWKLLRGLTIAITFAAAGCQQYDWVHDIDRAEAQAREQQKNMFIFYKYYLDPDSNRMLSSDVLSDPKVVSLFQNTVNMLIDKAYGPQFETYVSKYGVRSYPASILVAPDGQYEVLKGFVPKDRFIDFVHKFEQAHPLQTATSKGQ